MQSQEHSFDLPSCIEQEVQFCLKHILDKFRLYYISECGSSIAQFESAISLKVLCKSIRNPSCSSRIPNIKTINNIADYNLYISMAKLKAKLPAPGHLTVNFFPAPGHLTVNFSPAPGHLCTKILLTPGMPGGDGQGKN